MTTTVGERETGELATHSLETINRSKAVPVGRERERERERGREGGRERGREREGERDIVRGRESVCVCMCARERERKRERERA